VELPAHVPVLLREVLEALRPERGGVYVDATLGLGGHAEAILAASAGVRLVGIDRDPEALVLASERLGRFGDRFVAVEGRHEELALHLDRLGLHEVDGVLADLGVSSMQLDRAERGFSFMKDGPLDMRMGPSGPTAASDAGSPGLPSTERSPARSASSTASTGSLLSTVTARQAVARSLNRISALALCGWSGTVR